MTGKVTVKANADSAKVQYNHLVTADAASAGGKTAVGGAFIVTWISNNKLNTSKLLEAIGSKTTLTDDEQAIKDGYLPVTGKVTVKANADSAKVQYNHLVTADAASAGGLAGKYGGMDGGEIMNDSKDRQKSETAENSVSGAGAFVLNMQKNKVRAEILDDVDIDTKGAVSVHSANRTDATIKANASTTNSDVGVGVGIALNIVKMDNIARVGNGGIRASGLEVVADIAEAPTKMRTITPVEGASGFKTELTEKMTEAIRSLVGEDVYPYIEPMVTGSSSFVSTFYDKLIKDLNLESLFNVKTDGLEGSFTNAANKMWERLQAFPNALVAPLWDVVEQGVDSVSGMDEQKLKDIVETAWKAALIQVGGDAMSIFTSTVTDNKDALIGGVIDMIVDKAEGKGNQENALMDTLKDTVKTSFSKIVDAAVKRMVTALSAELPIINANNIEMVKSLKDTTMEKFAGSIVPYITETFRTEVYDYEPLAAKIQESGLTEYLESELRSLLKESTVAMTNEMIDKALGKLNVKFEREAIADRHIITTQAISGSGAKETSGAGSLAIAVANLTTKAEIADGKDTTKTIDITDNGALVVNAEEARRIRTHATAAVDADGEADNNEGAGDTENAQTGGSAAAQEGVTSKDGMVTVVTSGAGGSVKFGDSEDGRLYITLEKGYKLSNKSIVRTYTNADGDEVIDTVTLEEYGDDYLVIPTEGAGVELLDDDEKKNFHISLDIQFEEDLRAIPAVTLISTLKGLGGENEKNKEYNKQFKDSGKEITYSVEGKEGSDTVGKAKQGDLVEITIPQVGELDPYVVDVYDGDGNIIARYTLEPQYEKVPAGAQTMTKVSSNANETVLAFRMTDADIGKVELLFSSGFNNWGKKKQLEERDAEEAAEQEPEKSQDTDRAGRKVGVGAAFTLTYGNSDVKATIGERYARGKNDYAPGVTAGSVAVTASSDHEEENYATAGTDPLEGVNVDEDSEKDVGVDASVSLNILDNDIIASIAKYTVVKTTRDDSAGDDGEEDEDEEEEEIGEDEPEPIKVGRGGVVVDATEIGASETKASAFATGSTSAVGASVALNISLSDIKAKVGYAVDAAGRIDVRAHSLSMDDTWSFASAMGADMQRNLNKVSKFTDGVSDLANSLTTGSIFDKKAKDADEKKKSNDTSKRITDRLNNDQVKSEDGSEASENLSVSTNALRAMGAKFDKGGDAKSGASGATDIVNQQGGQSLGGDKEEKDESPKLQVAAAVGVTVALHNAAVEVDGARLKAGEGVSLTARNAGNFNTRSTAASMGLEDSNKGNSIAAAVGVSVNNNKATVDVYSNIDAGGDVTVDANLTQNLTDTYKGRLAVQSISGAVSGDKTEKSISGAISALVSHATTRASIVGNEEEGHRGASEVKGANVSVTATDKSKLAIRAGGINVSKGAATGMGMSAATIWSGNDVKANLGSAIDVTADSFTLNAQKLGVTYSDYEFPFTWQDLISDSSDLDDEERENVYTGLIDVHRKPGETAYTVDVNLDTYALMKIPDMLNFLSSNNYYVEAIAGSVMKKSSEGDGNKLNLSGSVSIVRTNNKINTVVGNNATITTRKKAEVNGVDLQARGDNNTRLIGGALTAGEGKNSAGLVVTFLSATDVVKTTVGSGVTIDAGNVNQKAHSDVNVQSFNAAAAVNSADKDEAKTIGGALDILLLNNKVENSTGELTTLNSGNDIDIGADAAMDLLVVSASLSAAKKGTAAGGTIQFVNDQTKASVDIAKDHSLTAGRNIAINAEAKDKVISVIASASGAPDDKSTAVAGSLNVINAATKGLVTIGAGSKDKNIKATKGDVTVKADTGANVINVTAAMAGSGGKAVGLSANVNVFNRQSEVEIEGGDGYAIKAGGNVQAEAAGNDFTVMAGLAASGSTGEGAAVSGNLPIVVGLNTVKTTLNKVAVEAGGSVAVTSHLKDRAYAIAGTIAASNAGNAVGATAMVVVKENAVKTDLGESSVTAGGGKQVKIATTGKNYKGVYVDAKVRQTLVAGAAGVAAGGAKGVTANIVTVVSGNEVKSDASKATLNAKQGNTTVKAENDSKETVFAGGLSIGKSMGAGASIVVAVARNDVKAQAHDLEGAGDVNVIADNDDKYILLNVNVGASGGNAAELGVTVTSLESKANAEVASKVTSKEGSFSLKANNTSNITNVAVALAAGAKNAATPVFVYTGYTGEANAMLKAGTVNAKKGVTVAADSNKVVDQYTIGMSASGNVALSGAVSIMNLGDATNAIVAAPTITNAAKMDVTADSDYKLVGATGTIAASGKAGVAVNGMLTIVKASTLAEMGGKATLAASEGMNVKASSKRDVISAALSVGVGGTGGGVSVGVMGLIAGDKMDQEAADQLVYGNDTHKETKVFDAGKVIDTLKKRGINTPSMNNLSKDLEGNGKTTDTTQLGHSEGSGTTFDVASGYSDGTDTGATQAHETGDVKRAKAVGSTAYSDSPKDAVIARISESADITGGVSVKAEQETLADMYGASVGAGGTVGGGISIAIAKLRSNVLASSLGTIHANDNQVTVEAVSKSGESKADDDEKSRTNALKTSLGDKITPAKRSIRSIGLAAADGGEVGAAVAAGFVRLDNITEATLAGHVEKASGIDVKADADYNNVLAATIAAAVGSTAGIAGSLAIAVADGTVKATMGKNKTAANAVKKDGEFEINSKDASSAVNVTTHSNFGANAITVSAAGGLVGGAGGVAIATNNLTQDTTVERGAKLTDLGKAATLNVSGTSTSAADGYLLGLSAGAGAVGIGVSVVKVKPTLKTTVGVSGATSGTTTLDGFTNVNVLNDATSAAESNLVSAAVGSVTVGVNVMTVFNDTDATAKVANLAGSVNNLNISGQLGAAGESNVTAVSFGAAGLGVTVNYVDVNSKNRAEADLTNGDFTISDKLSVVTGDPHYSRQTTANATSTAAAAAIGTIAVNTAIAHNRAQNVSVINGSTLKAKNVTLKSYSMGDATADLMGLDVSDISVATSVVNARNEATSSVKMNLSGALEGDLDAHSDVQGNTKAKLLTGGGSLLGSVKTNVATANGATNALLDVAIGGASDEWRTISALVTGKDDVSTDIDNLVLTNGALSVATMVGGAHSKDVYDNKVRLSGGNYKLNRIDVITSHDANTRSEVTPSGSGVDISLISVGVNKSTATSKVYAGAKLTVQDATLQTNGVASARPVNTAPHVTNGSMISESKNADVNVLTVGSHTVDASIRPATFKASGVGIGVGKARAEESATQAATLELGNGGIEKAGNVYVQSVVARGNTSAVYGASGVEEGMEDSLEIGAVLVDINTAKAIDNLTSTAAVLGGPTGYKTEKAWVDEGEYVTEHKVYTNYDNVIRYAWRDTKTGEVFDVSDLEMAKRIVEKDNGKKWNDKWNTDSDLIDAILNLSSGHYNLTDLLGVLSKAKLSLKIENRYKQDVEVYETYEDDVDVWVPKLVYKDTEVPIYGNPENNILKAGNLFVRSGTVENPAQQLGKEYAWEKEWNMPTTVTARTNGAGQNGLVTVGNLDGHASATESFNTVLKGVNIDLTGDAAIKAATNAVASANGTMPGGWALVGVGVSNIHADIGREGDAHTAKIIVTDGVQLKAQHIDMTAYNEGDSSVDFQAGTMKAVVSVRQAKQPTRNWYDTGILLDGSTVLESRAAGAADQPDLRLHSETFVKSTSKSKSSTIGILYNANSTYGEVHSTEGNYIDIGSGAKLTAAGALDALALNRDKIEVETAIGKGKGLIAGSKAYAVVEVDRTAQVNVGDGAQLTAGDALKLRAVTGEGDFVNVLAEAEAGGGFAAATADAKYKGTSNAAVNIGKHVPITAEKDVDLKATATSWHKEAAFEEEGVQLQANALGKALRMKPDAKTTIQMNFDAAVNINHLTDADMTAANKATNQEKADIWKTTITSKQGNINVTADNEFLFVRANSNAEGYSGWGTAKADTHIVSNLHNLVWVDYTDMTAAKGNITILARNGNMEATRGVAKLYSYAECTNKSVVGSVKARNYFEGSNWNQIRSNDTKQVTFKAKKVVHTAAAPWDNDNLEKIHEHSTHKSGAVSRTSEHYWDWNEYWRCDFCGKSGKKDGDAEAMSGQAEQYTKRNLEEALRSAFEKALAPLTDIQRQVDKVGSAVRARYGEEEYAQAGAIYVLEYPVTLEKDVTIDVERIAKYKLWTNTETGHDVYLLPNATRLYGQARGGKINLDYVAEVIRGDIRGNGEIAEIDIITALTKRAFANPVIPIGSTGSLDFLNGLLMLPSHADFELYLHEVSGSWLVRAWQGDYMQALIADQDAINNYAINGGDLPQGTIASGLIDGGKKDGWQLWWIGDSPKTAAEADQTLIGLLVNSETDEADAFRTTVNAISNDEPVTDVSLYLYRDSKSDRMEEEKYNVIFFDTPQGEKSLVKVITNVLMGREMETPLPMHLVLRAFDITGADLPVYSISGHYFAMCDGTDGQVSMFENFYTNTFDGDVFDSDYICIKGIVDGNLNVTIKESQPIWPEWTGENTAEDIQDNQYERIDGIWYDDTVTETSEDEKNETDAAA